MQDDFEETERRVLRAMKRAGWDVRKAKKNQRGFDLVATKSGQSVPVQVKNFSAPVSVRVLRRVFDYICSPEGAQWPYALLVTSSSFAVPALAWYAETASARLRLATFDGESIHWQPLPESAIAPTSTADAQTLIGVFTAKGGVGKTTCSAHLAGAMALSGYRVALIDLDPQYNLKNLLGDGISITRKGTASVPLRVFTVDEWMNHDDKAAYDYVVCDCSPRFEDNPIALIRRFRFCLIPTTLNPLGLNKNGMVINDTLAKIRGVNESGKLFVFVNNFIEESTQLSAALLQAYRRIFKNHAFTDDHFEIIDPEEAAIRHSKQLYNWGRHLFLHVPKALAFQAPGGRCAPKEDFLCLLQYLQQRTDLGHSGPQPDP